MSDSPQKQIVIMKSEKNVGLAVALAFFFGPIGLLYSTPVGGIVMFIVSVPVLLLTVGFGLLLTVPICCIWAWKAASDYNKKLHDAAGK